MFTRENFSYVKIFTVLGSSLGFLLLGFLFGSEKGYFVGTLGTVVGLIYLFCRVVVDLGPKARVAAIAGMVSLIGGASFFVNSSMNSAKSAKLDDAGLVWQLTPFGKSGLLHDVSIADDGNIFVVGAGKEKKDERHIAFGKVSPDGKLLWKNSQKDAPIARLHAVASLPDGGAIMAGYEGLVMRVDEEGSPQWSKYYGKREVSIIQNINDVAITPDGSIAIVGHIYSREETHSGYNAYIALLGPDGDLLWEKVMGTARETKFTSVALSRDSSIIVVGSLEHESKGTQARMVEIDLEGQVLNDLKIGGNGFDTASVVFVTESGQVLIGGTAANSYGGYDMAIFSVDDNMNSADLVRYSGPYVGQHGITAIGQKRDGELMYAGHSRQAEIGIPYTASIFNVDANNIGKDVWHDPFVNGGAIGGMVILPSDDQIILIDHIHAYPSSVIARRRLNETSSEETVISKLK